MQAREKQRNVVRSLSEPLFNLRQLVRITKRRKHESLYGSSAAILSNGARPRSAIRLLLWAPAASTLKEIQRDEKCAGEDRKCDRCYASMKVSTDADASEKKEPRNHVSDAIAGSDDIPAAHGGKGKTS